MYALELLRRIPRGSWISITALRETLADDGLQRSVRTTQRQLSLLMRHFDIECNTSDSVYSYRWKNGAKALEMQSMTGEEALLLTLAHENLASLLPPKLMQSMAGFFGLARDTALRSHGDASKEDRQWMSKVRVISTTQPLLPPTIQPGVLEEVSNALYANLWLAVDYKNAQAERKIADVKPLGLAQQGASLYLVCRFDGYANERSLALHRIVTAKASTLKFDRPTDFNLQQYDADGRFGFGEGQRIRLSFRIDKGAGLHLLESRLSEDQQHQDVGEHYDISATVVDTAQLEWWLRGFGDSVSQVRREPALAAG